MRGYYFPDTDRPPPQTGISAAPSDGEQLFEHSHVDGQGDFLPPGEPAPAFVNFVLSVQRQNFRKVLLEFVITGFLVAA